MLIPGGIGSRRLDSDTRLLAWRRQRAATTRRMVSVCTGIYILAATGLLDGRRVTTHWRYASEVARRYPALDIQPDPLLLRDGRFATSGGLTAGMDLALALVEEDLGAAVAMEAARDLVMHVKRPGNQAPFSMLLAAQIRGAGRMAGLLEWLLDHLPETLSVERMAEFLAMSPHNFRRVFAAAFATTPARFVERLRLEQARLQLTSREGSIQRIARVVGFNSADTFHRAFRNRCAITPGEYRQRFGSEAIGRICRPFGCSPPSMPLDSCACIRRAASWGACGRMAPCG
ncbi:GlxA family transcriptional regulator [Xanthomonas theicola]|uniref:GlxA family transcriptional regulator n=1 Tax=Xanthomonas theicola TaxID=56464 RepID=UPI00130491C6|nr:helix-turn-helix domain-containing protein [Xanthomonas theicola]QNH26830.1 helix-turn-helix domain-containing protein [Xanthomonas theicola]